MMTLVIDQFDELDWCSFNDEALHCYQLSRFQLIFSGRLSAPSSLIEKSYIPHTVDLYNRDCYRDWNGNYPHPNKIFDGYPISHHMEMPEVFWQHFVPYGDDVAIVGHCRVGFLPTWVNIRALDGIDDLREPEQLADYLLKVAAEAPEIFQDLEGTLYPRSRSELVEHDLKGRLWFEEIAGHISVTPKYYFTTALTAEHILTIAFHPRQHWPQGTLPSDSMKEKVFRSFWVFMEGLSLIEDQHQQIHDPGVSLPDKTQHEEKNEQWDWSGDVSEECGW